MLVSQDEFVLDQHTRKQLSSGGVSINDLYEEEKSITNSIKAVIISDIHLDH